MCVCVCVCVCVCSKLSDTAGVFSSMKQGGYMYRFFADTVYSGHTGRYGTKLTPLTRSCASLVSQVLRSMQKGGVHILKSSKVL